MTSIYFNDVTVEQRLLQEGVLVMSVKQGKLDLFVAVDKKGYSIMGETYPEACLDGNVVRFQRDVADRVQEETILLMPSDAIAERADDMLRDELARYA